MTIAETLPSEPVTMETDVNKVAGILDNLLENAARYAGEAAEVRVTLHVDRENARIAVVDNGPGIPMENLPHLFDRFYRGTGRIKGGLGIGLYASRALAEDLGGVLTAASEPGEGATFLLELPIAMPRWARPPLSASASGE